MKTYNLIPRKESEYITQKELEDLLNNTPKTPITEKPIPKTPKQYNALTEQEAIQELADLVKKPVESICKIENGHVVRLYLHSCNLTEFPEQIQCFPYLRKLYLHNNQLESILPEIEEYTENVEKLTLKELHIYNNPLTLLPEEINVLRKKGIRVFI
ncbi:MAG: hypothetical protein PHW96_04385 [Candidatus Nanoarchaeia archaeon]|nr:hypothetical protein [Candidatus Nanoarchaeia archaeon]